MKVLAIIPARSGSKSVQDKNIRPFNGQPLLSYSIRHALESSTIDRVIVSTDSEQYAAIARECGAEVPFIRPKEYATDTALDIDVFEHALKFLEEKENYVPDIVVHLRPTYPIRNVADIDAMVELLNAHPEADSVRCIAPAKETPYKMWRKGEDGVLRPLLDDIFEGYNMPRQQLPKVYSQNACIDVVRGNTIVNQHSMTGGIILGYEMTHNFDIDTEQEFLTAEMFLKFKEGGNRYVFDIDGVIANKRDDLDYSQETPNNEIILIIKRLYEAGNNIVLFTARGYVTGKDWKEVTARQMQEWGVPYHELIFGKPNATFYIDDKSLSVDDLKRFSSLLYK